MWLGFFVKARNSQAKLYCLTRFLWAYHYVFQFALAWPSYHHLCLAWDTNDRLSWAAVGRSIHLRIWCIPNGNIINHVFSPYHKYTPRRNILHCLGPGEKTPLQLLWVALISICWLNPGCHHLCGFPPGQTQMGRQNIIQMQIHIIILSTQKLILYCCFI